MKKEKIVVFTQNNAVVLTNQYVPGKFLRNPQVVVNPDLNEVLGVPPHFWKHKNGHVSEMSRPEKILRMKAIKLYGTDNNWARIIYKNRINYWKLMPYVSIIFLTALVTYLGTKLIHV